MADISICGRFLRISNPTGTQRSSRALLVATLRKLASSAAIFAPLGSEFVDLPVLVNPVPFRRGGFDHLWEQVAFPLQADGPLIWSLMGTGPVFHPGKRHVMVVHDLNYEILPRVFGKAFRLWYRFACGVAARQADVVVCFTEYVRGTIQRRLGIGPDRIRVIPQGPGLAGLGEPDQDRGAGSATQPYFLCVGSLQPHKNITRILAAWEIFRHRHRGYCLKVVGRAQGNFASLGVDLSKLPSEVEFTGYISDEKLIDLYRGATGFVYPSIEEGFGLPVVESFYCGCPVITSNRSCLPEVAAEAAILVDPNDPTAIVEAMALLAASATKQNELRARGFERAKLFTWENAGRLMANILEESYS